MTRSTYSSFNDNALSLICGLALLLAVRAAYDIGVGYLPDTLLISGIDPITRLALARFVLFAVVVTPLAMLLAWPLARHAGRRDLVVAMPGASCATMLFILLEYWQPFDPFPMWFIVARSIFLFAIFPVALLTWWRMLR